MAKYTICYLDKEGDTSKVWVEARNKEEAIQKVKREYWDIDSIIYVQ